MKSKRKGMTLVEIIIAIAILAIISISFLTMFTLGFKGIVSAGSRSKAQFMGQSNIEQDISSPAAPSGTDSVSIIFGNNPLDSIQVNGKIKTDNTSFRGRNIDITYFVPNK